MTLHESDSGKTFTYNVATRLSVYLDDVTNPQKDLRCTPEGVIQAQGNLREVEGSSYSLTFETVALGTCVLSNRNFSATIVVQ